MATLKELRDERLRKLNELKSAGIEPYPDKTNQTNSLKYILDNFDKLKDQTVTVNGRIKNIRKFGKIAFIVISSDDSELQLFLNDGNVQKSPEDKSSLDFSQLNLLDSGDFIESAGQVIKTQTGEISVESHSIRLLAKSLRPLPTKQDGFSNKEERLRRRYVDLNVNKEIKQRFIRRSMFWQSTREYLINNGFTEINIPVLEHTTGGADANPFVTHMDSLNQDFYLRISHELPLKKLIGGGFDKVFDIGPRFRNENYTDEHLPEHIAMEWYWAYADWAKGMSFMEDMYKAVAEKTYNKTTFKINNFEIDLSQDWQKLDYADALKDKYNLDVYNCTIEDVKVILKDHNLEVEKTDNLARSIDKLWKKYRSELAGPLWLINTPEFLSPLSKNNPDKPGSTERFQAVIAGTELGNGFSELNDPVEQLNRFVKQQKQRDSGDKEAMMLDIDFIEMLEYGMPPTCGFGYSERVFWVLEGVSAREGVPFPHLRADTYETTKKIYPDLF